MDKLPYFGHILTRWRVGNSTFLALPEKGARLMNWSLALADGSIRDVIHWPELSAEPGEFHKIRGGNPLLFPFAGRSFDRGEIFFWRDGQGVRRSMPMHGLARQGDFKVARLDPYGFEALFAPGEEAAACYPFKYEFTVTYRFFPLGLTCEFGLLNLGSEPLPWSAGHHFYFTLPWSEGQARKDYLIRIPASRRFRQDPAGQLVPGPQLAVEEPMDNPALVDAIHANLRGSRATFGEKGRPGDVGIRIGADKTPPADAIFVTWTQDGASPFYCVEPWMGPPNAPETKVGLHLVPPGEKEIFTVSVDLS